MVKKLFLCLVCLLSAWSVLAQQVMPERESQRVYISFGEAAEKMIASAVARSNPGATENLSQSESYKRVLEYAKQIGAKANAKVGGNDFSYMSFVPYFTGKLYGEISSYTFGFGIITTGQDREPGAFSYRMAPVVPAPYVMGGHNFIGRIYEPDVNHAFKTMPRLIAGVLSTASLCSGSSLSCFPLKPYVPGSFKWHNQYPGQSWMVACNDVSDCVRASANMLFYHRTFTYRRLGYDSFSQYWGNYQITTSGNCNDTSEYSYLRVSLIDGLMCIYSERYDYTTGANAERFSVGGTLEDGQLRYIALNPIPILCPGIKTYPELLNCDARFANDVLSLKSLTRMVDRLFFYGTQRAGYRGVKYTIVSEADAVAVLAGRFVKVASLAEKVDPPTPAPPLPPASAASAPALDLGPNPATPAPEIEDISAASVLAPIWQLFPSLRSYDAGTYTVQCPVFTSSLYGRSYLIKAHCELAEGQRVALGVMSLIAWACTALFVVIRA